VSDFSWIFIQGLVLLFAFFCIALPPLFRQIKREAALPNKLLPNGDLDEADEAVRRWKASLRLPKCQTCKYWQPIWLGGKGPQLTEGVCYRYPPHMSRRKRITNANARCGEHVELPL
jgi:hypothetical protein